VQHTQRIGGGHVQRLSVGAQPVAPRAGPVAFFRRTRRQRKIDFQNDRPVRATRNRKGRGH